MNEENRKCYQVVYLELEPKIRFDGTMYTWGTTRTYYVYTDSEQNAIDYFLNVHREHIRPVKVIGCYKEEDYQGYKWQCKEEYRKVYKSTLKKKDFEVVGE